MEAIGSLARTRLLFGPYDSSNALTEGPSARPKLAICLAIN